MQLKAIASNIYSNTINVASCMESIYDFLQLTRVAQQMHRRINECEMHRVAAEDMGNEEIRNT